MKQRNLHLVSVCDTLMPDVCADWCYSTLHFIDTSVQKKKKKSYTVDLMHIGYYLGFVVLLKGP